MYYVLRTWYCCTGCIAYSVGRCVSLDSCRETLLKPSQKVRMDGSLERTQRQESELHLSLVEGESRDDEK